MATGSFELKAVDMQIVEKLQVLPLHKRTESVTGDNKIPQHGVGSGNLHKHPQPASTLVLLQTVISHKLLYCSDCRSRTSKLLLELLISSACLPCAGGARVNTLLFLIKLLLPGSRQGSNGWREYFPSLTLSLG